MSTIIFLAIGAVFAVGMGIARWRQSNRELAGAHRSRAWERGEGTITWSELEVDEDSEGSTYRPNVQYSYQVLGVELSGHRVYFGDRVWRSDSTEPQQVVDRYPVGTKVIVFFDPLEPKQSVLVRGDERGVKATRGQALLAFVVGLVFLGALFWQLFVEGIIVL